MSWYDFLRNYDGRVLVNGKDIKEVDDSVFDTDCIDIDLTPRSLLCKTKYRIKVKGWMCNNGENLDFHNRWNNGEAMPSSEMTGEILGETPGMWKMDLKDKEGKRWIGYVSKSAILEKEEVENETNKNNSKL